MRASRGVCLFDSPDVKGIKTSLRARSIASPIGLFDSPDVKGIKTLSISTKVFSMRCLFDSPDVKGIKTRSDEKRRIFICLFDSPDVKGIKTVVLRLIERPIRVYSTAPM